MSTPLMIVAYVLGAVGIAANFAYWWWVVTRGEKRWRARVERRYGVRIDTGFRGTWNVVSERHGWFARLGIEILQLAYFMAAFVVWSLAVIGALILAGGP